MSAGQRLFLGIATAAGYTLTVVATDHDKAADKLYKLWRKMVYPGFETQISNGKLLLSEADASVVEITNRIDKAFVWEQAE